MKKIILVFSFITLIAAACNSDGRPTTEVSNTINDKKIIMNISSPSFQYEGNIPEKFTCEGENISPELNFESVPSEAKSLALLMDDPDVPKNLKPDGVFDHWTVFNMPATTVQISENSPAPGITGKNGAGQNKYTGPCPPDREHRYFFKLYALDTVLSLNEAATKTDVLKAMEGHIIAEAELMGKYNKKANR